MYAAAKHFGASLAPSVAGLTGLNLAVSAAAAADSRLRCHFEASWDGVTAQGRWWGLLTAQFNHDSYEHLLTNTAMLVFCGAFLHRVLTPPAFVGIYLVSGAVGTSASVLRTAWLYGPPAERDSTSVQEFNKRAENQAIFLRLGFMGKPADGGLDLRHNIGLLTELYRPYKLWQHQSTVASLGSSASVSGVSAALFAWLASTLPLRELRASRQALLLLAPRLLLLGCCAAGPVADALAASAYQTLGTTSYQRWETLVRTAEAIQADGSGSRSVVTAGGSSANREPEEKEASSLPAGHPALTDSERQRRRLVREVWAAQQAAAGERAKGNATRSGLKDAGQSQAVAPHLAGNAVSNGTVSDGIAHLAGWGGGLLLFAVLKLAKHRR